MQNIFFDNTNEDITVKTNFNKKEKAVVLYLFNKQIEAGFKFFDINIEDLADKTNIEENNIMDILKSLRAKEVKIIDKKIDKDIITGIISSIESKNDTIKEIEMPEPITRYLKY
jgi:hypothetical protein